MIIVDRKKRSKVSDILKSDLLKKYLGTLMENAEKSHQEDKTSFEANKKAQPEPKHELKNEPVILF